MSCADHAAAGRHAREGRPPDEASIQLHGARIAWSRGLGLRLHRESVGQKIHYAITLLGGLDRLLLCQFESFRDTLAAFREWPQRWFELGSAEGLPIASASRAAAAASFALDGEMCRSQSPALLGMLAPLRSVSLNASGSQAMCC